MREVLFKAKRIGDGEWTEGSLLKDERGNCYIGTYIEPNCSKFAIYGRRGGKTLKRFAGIGFVIVDPNTVCQYTGLTDKNGNRIWENDIVRFKHEKFDFDDELNPWKRIHCQKKEYKRNYVVEFCNTPTHYGLRLRNGSIWFKVHKMTILMHDAEVIGNIFDNPELLEVE